MIVKSSFIGIAYNYAICYLYNLMDNARKKRKYRAIVACLLLLTMMPFFFVKAFHVHKEDLCISHDEQQSSHHDSADKCAICCSLYLHLPKPRALSTIAFRQRTPLNILSKRRRTLLLLFPYCLSALLLSNYYNPSHGLHAL